MSNEWEKGFPERFMGNVRVALLELLKKDDDIKDAIYAYVIAKMEQEQRRLK